MERARSRAAGDASRARDAYERDSDLQLRVDAVYRRLAEIGWMSPRHLYDGEDIDALADRLTR